MEKDKKNTFLTQNTLFGLFIGLSYILAAYVYYRSGKGVSLNPQLNNVIMLLSIAGAFISTRKYRDESLEGTISYGKALGCCVYVIAISSVIYGIYVYTLYHRIPELQENYMMAVDHALREVYANSPLLETMTAMVKAFTSPASIAFAEIFNKIITGFIFSLFLAGILRRTRKI